MSSCKRTTIHDIAQLSGFSTSTVSLVLNNRVGIAEETRELVIQAAKNLGYDQAHLKSRRRKNDKNLTTLGLLLRLSEDELSQSNPFYSVVVSGIEEACRLQNIQLFYTHVKVDLRNRPYEIPNIINNHEIDGLMLVGVYLGEPLQQALKNTGIPVVLVDAYSNDNIYDSVVTNNFQGAYQAVSYLFQKGHKRIAMIGANPGIYPSFDERRYGYQAALRDCQIDCGVFYGCVVHRSGDSFYQTAQNLLNDHSETTAIYCANDSMAIETIRAAQDLQIRVPEDLSVVGFDDIDIASYITPPLTTLRVDKSNLGRLAVRVLQQHIQFPGFPPITHTLPVKLIERKSVSILSRIDVD